MLCDFNVECQAYAARVVGKDEPVACSYNGNEAPNYPPFSYLCRNIERMFITGQVTDETSRKFVLQPSISSKVI